MASKSPAIPVTPSGVIPQLLYECPCLEFTRSFQLSEQVRAVQFPKEVRKKRLRTNTGARIARSLCLALQDSTSSDRRETRYPIAFDRWPERPSESFLQCRVSPKRSRIKDASSFLGMLRAAPFQR